jgi:predicted nuclease of restriction endonuclease-like RecB superfamily
VIARVYEAPAKLPRLYGAGDLAWIGRVLDVVERSLGEPWRVLIDRVERAPLSVDASHRRTVLRALRRVLGGAGRRGKIARRVRGLVLGAPALDRSERDARLAAAATQLGITPADVESLLWVDLAKERPVALPAGRPPESALAAFANLDRIQRWVRRAHDLQLRVWDRANELVRTAARYGLIARIKRDGDATLLDVTGPLALFHSTTVYGRALAALVPLLADHARFALDIRCELGGDQAHVTVAPPVLLPPVPVSPRRGPSIAERLAQDLADRGHRIEREPPPIASGDDLLFPDIALDGHGVRYYVEVLGFSTSEYLASKLARYREAGARVVLCVDLAHAPGCELSAGVCSFTRRVDVDDLLAAVQARR